MRPRKWEHAGQQGDTTARRLKTDDRQKLRKKAEARAARAPPSAKPHQSTAALLHDLQVHQIELEMQNEELRRNQLELKEAHERQVELYDFAPVGYVTLDGNGFIVSANLTAATLLGVERGTLLGRPFPGLVTREDGSRWHLAFVALLRGGERAAHRLTLTRGDEATFDAEVVCERRSGHGGSEIRIVLTDFTARKGMEEALRAAEDHARELDDARLRGLDQRSNEIELVAGLDGRIVHANDRALEFYGYSRAEMLRLNVRDLRSESTRASVPEQMKRAASEGIRFETEHQKKDGTIFPVSVSSRSFEAGGDRYLHSLILDLTEKRAVEHERLQAEEALRARESKLSAYFHTRAVGIAVSSPEKMWVDVNDEFCAMLGYSREELARLTWAQLTHPDDLGADQRDFSRVLAGEIDGYSLDKRYIRKDGSVLWVLLAVNCARRPDRSVEFFVAVASDITARKKAEEALRANEEHQRRLFDNLDAGIVVHAPDTSIVQSNVKSGILLGLTPGQMRGKVAVDPGWGFVRDNGSPMPLSEYPVNQVVASGIPVVGQVIGIDRPVTGDRAWVLVNAYPEFDEARALRQVVVTFVDITSRKRSEMALESQNAMLSALINSPKDIIIFALDEQGRYTAFNEKHREEMRRVWNAEVRIGMRLLDCMTDPGLRQLAAKSIGRTLAGESCTEVAEQPGLGTHYQFTWSPVRRADGSVGGLTAFIRDITGEVTLQAKVAMTSRLAAMGTLVAGVAHEINNPLAAEMSGQGFAIEVVREVRERLRAELPLDRQADGQALDDVVEALQDAQKSGDRIARIVADLSIFGRPDGKRERFRSIDIIDCAMRWLPATITQTASIRVENDGVPDVFAAPGQIEQVVVNLITNAGKATPEGQRDTIIVRLGPGTPGMARLEVIDHGSGIAPAILERIFDPFFTTRPSGPNRGSGLGLAISHAIVTAHGGTLTVQSEVGKGSTFRVELPAAPVES
jgi:PAS domain S-box-containing protein